MNWTPLHVIILCKQVVFVNPYSAKKKSVQRSALWQKIADNLNSIHDPHLNVEKRSVRDHIGILVQRYKRQQAQELRESGTTPERTELEQIIAMEESADCEQQEINDENREKQEVDRKKGRGCAEKSDGNNGSDTKKEFGKRK